MLSAARHGGLERVVLHHTDDLDDSPVIRALQAGGVQFSRLNAQNVLTEVGVATGLGERLNMAYEKITSPVILSDILRAAILYRDGGIYMDVDTLTVASLQPLLRDRQFIGLENIVWPHWVKASRAPLPWAKALTLDILRKALRVTPYGWRLFRFVEPLYFREVNNAIMGGAPQAPFFKTYMQAMTNLPAALQSQTYALGPDLLQTLLREQTFEGLKLHEPETFYPLPPEISEHWFRPCHNATNLLKQVLKPQTRVAHWYASVRSKPYVKLITPDFVLKNRDRQLYSALVAQCLPDLDTF